MELDKAPCAQTPPDRVGVETERKEFTAADGVAPKEAGTDAAFGARWAGLYAHSA